MKTFYEVFGMFQKLSKFVNKHRLVHKEFFEGKRSQFITKYVHNLYKKSLFIIKITFLTVSRGKYGSNLFLE